MKWFYFSLYFSAIKTIRCSETAEPATAVDVSVPVAVPSRSGHRLTCALFAGITVEATKA